MSRFEITDRSIGRVAEASANSVPLGCVPFTAFFTALQLASACVLILNTASDVVKQILAIGRRLQCSEVRCDLRLGESSPIVGHKMGVHRSRKTTAR